MAAAEAARPLVSLHEHNEATRCREILDRLSQGEDVALISDAGTPLISDPGYRLVEAAIAAGIRVSPIPGPSAVISALCIAGLPTDQFVFIGFLPPKPAARRAHLESWSTAPATLVCFESPHRILESLADIAALWPARRMAACRELTKLHEEIAARLAARPSIKGEFTLVIDRGNEATSLDSSPASLAARVRQLQQDGLSRMDAIKQAAREAGLNKRAAYDLLEKEKA
jgi:16S rRNA (cytidine1402-2'-O)-methyltransferase